MRIQLRNGIIGALAICMLSLTGTACGPAVQSVTENRMTEEVKASAAGDQQFISSTLSVPGMGKIAESETLTLFFHSETTEIAVVDKKSGNIWYSNPPNRDEGAKAAGVTKEQLSSQLSVVFYNDDGQQYTMNNFSDSIKHQQFEAVPIENGMRITYQLGDVSLGIDAIPKKISKERLDSFLAKMEKKSQKYILTKFKLNKETGIYERWDTALRGIHLKRSIETLAKAGYTEADLAQDNKENAVEGGTTGKEKPKFTVAVEYRLDGSHFVASVPVKDVLYPRSFPIHKIHLLDFFGAADQTKNGYMLVPDGSGSLIFLNNGKTAQEPFSQPVYGIDNTVSEHQNVQKSETTRLPVFGMKQGDAAFLAVIDGGDALANVNADISGRLNSYNYVFANFTTISKDELRMYGGWSGENVINIFQTEMYQGDLSVRYSFLSGEDADYSGMAKQYREYLIGKFGLTPVEAGTTVPFYLDVLGNIPKRTSFLGIPYNTMVPLTTFKQAEIMVDDLQKEGVANIRLRYSGWFNEGINHEPTASVSVDGNLGGKQGLKNFAKHLKEKGVQLYPDVAFLRVYQNTLGFWPSSQAARLISRKVAKVYPYDPATYFWDTETKSAQYILSPRELAGYVDGFASGYEPLEIGGLSLRDLGYEVNSDFKVGSVIDRQEASNIIVQQAKKLKERFPDLLVIGGNANASVFAKHVLMAPQNDSSFGITDVGIPFFQLVFHGYVQYSGQPINMNDDQNPRKNLLRALENGSGVYFQWMYADPASVKDTEFTYLYSVYYKDWMHEAISLYKEVNDVLGDTYAIPITKHEQLTDGVFKTTYENGKSIIVNYTEHDVIVDGKTVQAENYTMGGE